MSLGGLIYVQLEEQLRYGEHFYPDPQDPGRLFYAVRRENSGTKDAKVWKSLGAGELFVDIPQGFETKIDFSGTTDKRAEAEMTILFQGDIVYTQKYTICSLLGDIGESLEDE